MTTGFICATGKHRHRTEKQADSCSICRRALDSKVRAYFKAQSEKMLKPITVNWMD